MNLFIKASYYTVNTLQLRSRDFPYTIVARESIRKCEFGPGCGKVCKLVG